MPAVELAAAAPALRHALTAPERLGVAGGDGASRPEAARPTWRLAGGHCRAAERDVD